MMNAQNKELAKETNLVEQSPEAAEVASPTFPPQGFEGAEEVKYIQFAEDVEVTEPVQV